MKLRMFDKDIWNVFVKPVKKYYIGKMVHGCPYFYPRNFNSTIITVRKERPKYSGNKYFKLFGYEISYGLPIYITWHGLGWKDKWNSPRFEWCPSFYIFFFKWQLVITLNAPDGDNYKYYEVLLDYMYYQGKDIYKVRKNYGWVDSNGKSTWNEKYLISKESSVAKLLKEVDKK